MSGYRDLLDELFVTKLGYEFRGTSLQSPVIEGRQNLISLSKEYSANGVDVILAECNDRIFEFQKQLIRWYKNQFPDSHFLFISNQGRVFDLYNVSSSQKLKKISYNEIDKNTRLFKEKIELFNVEEANGTVDLKIKIDKAFDCSDTITKNFYRDFQKIHEKLTKAIRCDGVDKDKAWYASVLMNRLMFIYFLQKQRAIQDDYSFLLTKYEQVKKQGKDYYRDFLLPLFFYGFAKRDNNPEKQKFVKEYGYVKYLNGGLFYPHHIEKKYTPSSVSKNGNQAFDDPCWIIKKIKIDVDTRVLKEALDFLNSKTLWYADSRPLKNENEINADVLGYIFEMGVNEKDKKEKGTYYTKEDITGYISKNTIIPSILDKLRRNGFDAPDPNPMITNNEDIIAKMADYIEQLQDYKTFKFLYNDVLIPLSVLDPAVGSGAFLFAALNILLPIYRKVVFKLKAFREQKRNDEWLQGLCAKLDNHSEEYFLRKQIILNNLYGVDIVEEATEICKLRLFLQLASHLPNVKEIEPLPDLDFNIYAGNSLVGGLSWRDLEDNYTWDLFSAPHRETIKKDVAKLTQYKLEYKRRIDEQIRELAELKQKYRRAQQEITEENALNQLRSKIKRFTKEINRKLNIGTDNPFHWFIDFNQIMERGGFDVIIGNPPYVEFRNVDGYNIKGYKTIDCGDLYGFFVERSINILQQHGCFGFILPISLTSTDGFKNVRDFIDIKCKPSWYSTYSMRPGKLFDGVEKHLCIWLASKSGREKALHGTKYHRWKSEERDKLFSSLKYTTISQNIIFNNSLPKVGSEIEKNILMKILKQKSLGSQISRSGKYVIYHTRKLRYFLQFLDIPPKIIHEDGINRPTSELKVIRFNNEHDRDVALAAYCSTLFFWYYITYSDCRNLNKREVYSFPFTLSEVDTTIKNKLENLSKTLMRNLQSNSEMRSLEYKKYGTLNVQIFKPRLTKGIIDEIDIALGKHYGLTREEICFIVNYDLRFRMGDDE